MRPKSFLDMAICADYHKKELRIRYLADYDAAPKKYANNEDQIRSFIFCMDCHKYMKYNQGIFICPSCGEKVSKKQLYDFFDYENEKALNKYLDEQSHAKDYLQKRNMNPKIIPFKTRE